MKKIVPIVLALQLAAPAFAQTTTKPNVSNTLSQCAANVPVVGSSSGNPPACHASGALGPPAFAVLGQIPGTATNDNASAGKIGEYISSTVATGSAISLTTSTPANVTSISLTAGDWDVSSEVYFNSPATTSFTTVLGSISTTSATLNQTAGFWDVKGFAAFVPGTNGGFISCGVPFVRISLSGTTTVFLVTFATFTVSTATAWGTIQARRVR